VATELYRLKQYDLAIDCYYNVVNNSNTCKTCTTHEVCPYQEELLELEILSRLNIALCDINLKFYERAMQQSALIIKMDPGRVKAYIRLAQALFLYSKDKFKVKNSENAQENLKHCSYRLV
jgi:tetratricopeptide (TPR) repeat protein